MKVHLVQTTIADYRNAFIESLIDLVKSRNIDFSIFCGETYFQSSIVLSQAVRDSRHTIKIANFFLLGRRLLWQSLPFRELLSADVVVLELNPRIISNWLIILARRLLKKRVVLWGHAWPRSGPTSKSDHLRSIMRKSANALLLYTRAQRQELITYGISAGRLFVAPNSLYRSEQMYPSDTLVSQNSVIYVGRLVAPKKVNLLILAFKEFVSSCPDSRLDIVGSGPERQSLEAQCRELGLNGLVRFHGHVSDISALRAIYSGAFVSVSPGYVGLSITQSFSFGVPMLVARQEDHSPELEALRPQFNGDFFESDSPQSLAAGLLMYWNKRTQLPCASREIVQDCKARYSVEAMSRGFIDAVTSH